MSDAIHDNAQTTGPLELQPVDGDAGPFHVKTSTAAGEIETPGDADLFAVTLEAGKTYRIGVKGDASADGTLADPVLGGIFDANGHAISGASDDDSGAGANAQYMFRPTTTGTYIVAVQGDGTGTGTFTLQVDDLTPARVATSLGDITEQANATFVDDYLKAIENDDSTQLWTFTLSSPRQIDFLISHLLNKDTDFDLLDAEGRRMWESSDVTLSTDDESGARRLLHHPAPAGLYYIEINGKQLPEDDEYTMRYKVHTTLESPDWTYKLNDITDAAPTTLSDQPMFGIDGETDTYKFTLSEEKIVTFSVAGLEFDADLEIYDEDGNIVASSREYGIRNETVAVRLAASSAEKSYEARVVMQEDGSTRYDFSYALRDPVEQFFDLGDITGTFADEAQREIGSVQSSGNRLDHYTFTLTEERTVKLEIAPEQVGGVSGATYTVEDAAGQVVFSGGVEDDSKGLSRVLGPGAYTVSVYAPAAHADKTHYDLEISTLAPDYVTLAATDDLQIAATTTFVHPSGAHYYRIATDTASDKFFVRATTEGVALSLLDGEGNVLMESDGPGQAFVFADPGDGEDAYYVKAVPADADTAFSLTYELTPGADLGTVTQTVRGTYRFLREGLDDGEVTYHKFTLADPGEVYLVYPFEQANPSVCFDDVRVVDSEGKQVSFTYGLDGALSDRQLLHARNLEAGDYYLVVDYNGEPHCDTNFFYYAGSGAVAAPSTEGISSGSFALFQDDIAHAMLPALEAGQNYVLDFSAADGQDLRPLEVFLYQDDEFLLELPAEAIGVDGTQSVQFTVDGDASDLSMFIIAADGNPFPTVEWTLTPDDYTADMGTLGELAVGESLQGDLETDGDLDWIAVELSGGQAYRYGAEADWTSGTLFRGIYDSDGELVQSAAQTYTPDEDGIHYIAVGAGAGQTGQYTLTIEEDMM